MAEREHQKQSCRVLTCMRGQKPRIGFAIMRPLLNLSRHRSYYQESNGTVAAEARESHRVLTLGLSIFN